jgi:hypothetical protein
VKRLSLILLLVPSPALADTSGLIQDPGQGLAHPLARECVVTDTDCIVVHDARVITLATFMGVASYCKASTTPARCREAVAVTVKAEQRPATNGESTSATETATATATAKDALETATYLDLSGPPASSPEPEFPNVAKKGTL